MTDLLSRLEELLEKIPGGKWFWHKEDGRSTNVARIMNNASIMAFEIHAEKKNGPLILSVVAWKTPTWIAAQNLARYIALCNPETIRALVRVARAAEKIRHWHDTLHNKDSGQTEGMVVSAASVRELWDALSLMGKRVG